MRPATICTWLACLLPAVAAGAADYPDSVVATVSLGAASGPVGVCVSPSGEHVYAAAEFGIASAVETGGYTVDGSCYIGSELGGICITPDGQHLLVCNVEDGAVEVIEAGGMQHLATVEVGSDPAYIASTPDGSRVLVTCNLFQVWVIETDGWTVEETVSVGSSPRGICVLPEGGSACVARSDAYEATLVDLDGYTTQSLFTGADTWDVCPAPDGSLAYLTVPAWGMVIGVDLDTGQPVQEVSGVGEQPLDICALPGGWYLYVSSSETGEVFVVDASEGAVADSVATGSSPLGICAHPAGGEVYVADNQLGELVVIGGVPSGVEPEDPPGPPALRVVGPNPCASRTELDLVLPRSSQVMLELFDLAGRRLLLRREGVLAAGAHRMELEVPVGGVFICRVRTRRGSATVRLVSLPR